MNPSFAHISATERPGKPVYYCVSGSNHPLFVDFCWMAGKEWLPPKRVNVRRYSRFATKEAAIKAIPEGVTLVGP